MSQHDHMIMFMIRSKIGRQGGAGGKEPIANARGVRDASLIPGFRKIPWRRKWQPTPVFLPGKSHGQGRLVGYSPWDGKEVDTTEVT